MQMCSICHKNVATIYTAKIENGKTEMIGVCIECAKKMGLPVMDQLMQQAGITPEDMENISDQMSGLLENMDLENISDNNMFSNFLNGSNLSKEDDSIPPNNMDSLNDNEEAKEKKLPNVEKKQKTKSRNKLFKNKRKYLNTYGTNLTEKAKNNKIDNIIGRNREIDRVIQILNRRTKNNPVLIGEPGVGKTAIAEGLAVRIADKMVPAKLFNAEVYLLDLTAIVAGTQFRGQFEGRMKSIIEEAKKLGNIILIIDEIHNIIGAGEAQGGALNAANILKPALAKGEIQLIGATTLEEYRKYIEKDSALERRFQSVLVEEPTNKETIEILKGISHYYEEYHKVKISDEVIKAAVNLSERYITDRYLPDKAIDVIDEASSRANLKNKGLVEIQSLKEELGEIQDKIIELSNANDYEKAAQYKMNKCKVEDKIGAAKKECRDIDLTVEDIAFVIESWTKIPVHNIKEDEAEKLLNLEKKLHERIIGQNKAIEALCRAIRRNRLGFRKKKKPASFIFVGPTGVGKTELVKALSCELFGSEEALIRIDMSEYMEKHTVSKLIGAPPGYVGYDEGGQLTEKVRRKPYSVILLDEVEKAHPDVFNMLLQILEDGRLTDNQGRTVYFDNTVIVMTSNAGTNFKSGGIGFAQDGYDALESQVKDALKQTFKPEFLNRVDEIVVFSPLLKEELHQIINLMLKEVREEINEKNMTMEITDRVIEFILQKGYDKKYGARPLRRAIQRYIEDEIAEQYLQKKYTEGSHIKIDFENEKLVFE
ncbi:AAA family ATPase [Haloimpatiens sp. FM7330]|uniref:ATP-dependent Clp protease ATP-binding subunit n=1 Tax=Haloimpatiens sp. FM7330 TaxID=3298610 RepID=UPI003641108F